MKKVMYDANEVKDLINQGKKLILAGDESVLKQLPKGSWIAGTIPYFMAENGGVFTKDKIYLTELPSYVTKTTIKHYTENNISNIFTDAPGNGFSIVIIPGSCPTHLSFALNAPKYDGFATSPLIGWISGVCLDDLGKITPMVFSGENNGVIENGAVVIHVELPENKYAEINIINIFKQGTGDIITFPEDGFSATEAFINGVKKNFAAYLTENKFDIQLPLVADYCGAMINTSFQSIDETARKVNFYAPVFKDIQYKLASPVGDYVSLFKNHLPKEDADRIFFSCNCILNYLYSQLEGKQTGGITGPITFGEVAYQLLNQTMAYVMIGDVE